MNDESMIVAIHAVAAQVTPWFTNSGLFGGILCGAVGVLGGGIYGPLVGICVQRGKAKRLVLTYHWLLVIAGLGLLGAGLAALILEQPYAVWYPLVLPGGILTLLMLFMTPLVLRGYRQAEYRRLDAAAFRDG